MNRFRALVFGPTTNVKSEREVERVSIDEVVPEGDVPLPIINHLQHQMPRFIYDLPYHRPLIFATQLVLLPIQPEKQTSRVRSPS